MAKKGKKSSINDDDNLGGGAADDFAVPQDELGDDGFSIVDPGDSIDPTTDAGDDITYTMGDIQVLDSDSDEDEEFKKASQTITKETDNEDGDDDWEDEELEYNVKDEDPFLDMAEDYDMDNPYGEDY